MVADNALKHTSSLPLRWDGLLQFKPNYYIHEKKKKKRVNFTLIRVTFIHTYQIN